MIGVILLDFLVRFRQSLTRCRRSGIKVVYNRFAFLNELGNRFLSGNIFRFGLCQAFGSSVDRRQVLAKICREIRGMTVVTRLLIFNPSVKPFVPIGVNARFILRIGNSQSKVRRSRGAVFGRIVVGTDNGLCLNGNRQIFRFFRNAREVILGHVPRDFTGFRIDSHPFRIISGKSVFNLILDRFRGRRFFSFRISRLFLDFLRRGRFNGQGELFAGGNRLRIDFFENRSNGICRLIGGIRDHDFERLLGRLSVGIDAGIILRLKLFRRFDRELEYLGGNI